jgi:hypothetical protein
MYERAYLRVLGFPDNAVFESLGIPATLANLF